MPVAHGIHAATPTIARRIFYGIAIPHILVLIVPVFDEALGPRTTVYTHDVAKLTQSRNHDFVWAHRPR